MCTCQCIVAVLLCLLNDVWFIVHTKLCPIPLGHKIRPGLSNVRITDASVNLLPAAFKAKIYFCPDKFLYCKNKLTKKFM